MLVFNKIAVRKYLSRKKKLQFPFSDGNCGNHMQTNEN